MALKIINVTQISLLLIFHTAATQLYPAPWFVHLDIIEEVSNLSYRKWPAISEKTRPKFVQKKCVNFPFVGNFSAHILIIPIRTLLNIRFQHLDLEVKVDKFAERNAQWLLWHTDYPISGAHGGTLYRKMGQLVSLCRPREQPAECEEWN
jgi:hypothetical protein